MQSERETLELLLTIHFPNSEVTEEMAAACSDWRWPRGLSPIGEWNEQLILLPHTKVQKWMPYCPACCNRDGELLSLSGQDISCLSGY